MTRRHSFLSAILLVSSVVVTLTDAAPTVKAGSTDSAESVGAGRAGIIPMVAVGSEHTCALQSSGTIECWGHNFGGQLGRFSASPANPLPTAVTLTGNATATAVTAGEGHTCALLSTGGVECWGLNSFGQLGHTTNSGNNTPTPVPTPVPLADSAIAVDAGANHTCALLSNGTIECWGFNYYGQLASTVNVGTLDDNPTPSAVTLTGSATATALAAGGTHTCALLSTGTVECWGGNRYGQLGNVTNNGNDTANPTPSAVGLATGASAITAGGSHVCALLTNGGVDCWGDNRSGQLGTSTNYGTGAATPTPSSVSLSGDASSVAAGIDHNCAVIADGDLQCWGNNFFGQLASTTNNGNNDGNPTPSAVTVGGSATAVAADWNHTCAMIATGDIECWGKNRHGQLANATNNGTDTANPIPSVVVLADDTTSAVAIATGGSHTCALVSGGTVDCWGFNYSGQIGSTVGTTSYDPHPIPIGVTLSGTAVDIGAGSGHSCALLATGAIDCWGTNVAGQLGTTTNNGLNSPNPAPESVALTPGAAATAIAVGGDHTCALFADGTVSCWGNNRYGQLGIAANSGTNAANPAPTSVGLTSTAIAVAAGANHTCALLSTGTLECWGLNDDGQLGNSTNNDDPGSNNLPNPTPASVTLTTDATAIAVGGFHTCALLATGVIECWGNNFAGQLATATNNGNSNANPTPAPVSLGGAASAITAGNSHTCAVLAAGILKCWGLNIEGQLGNGANLNTNNANAVPVAVTQTSGVIAVAAGEQHSCAVSLDRAIECWGANFYGQLGHTSNISTGDPNPDPIEVGSSSVAVTPIVTPTTGSARFLVTFDRAVTGFDDPVLDVVISGSAGGTLTASIAQLTPSTYEVTVTGMTSVGDVTLGVAPSAALSATYLQPNSPSPSPATVDFITLPDAPSDLTATGGDTTAQLSWTAPVSDGGSPITGYLVEISLDGGALWTTREGNTGSAATTFEMTQLGNGVPHLFRVAAINGAGIGSASTASNEVTPTPPPTATIALADDQSSPFPEPAVAFDVIFDQPVTFVDPFGFTGLSFGGSAGATEVTGTGAGPDGDRYIVWVSGMTGHGTVTLTVDAGAAVNANAQPNPASNTATADHAVPAGAPTGLTAVGGDTTALLSWTAPADNGGSPITGYVVEVSLDGGVLWTTREGNTGTAATTFETTELGNGTPHLFRVAAINGAGIGIPSNASNEVTPTSSAVTPLAPARFVDTRSSGETLDDRFEAEGKRAEASEYRVQIAGRGDVPLGAKGVVLNITAIAPDAVGFVTVHPCVTPRPLASSLNYTPSVNLGNEIIAPLSASGELCLFTSAAAHLTVDVVGFIDAESPTTPVNPGRFLDTRPTGDTIDDAAEGGAKPTAGSTTRLQVGGRGQIPVDAAAVIVNVTAIGAETTGYITAHACLTTPPNAASLNFVAGVNRGNELIVDLSADGELCLFTSSTTHLAADVVGYVPAGSTLTAVGPARLLDTRDVGDTIDGDDVATGKRTAGSSYTLQVTGRAGVPADATAVVINITAVAPEGIGYVTVHPCLDPTPNTASLNHVGGVNGGNEIVAKLDELGRVCIFTSTATHLTADIVGHITS